jgi:hypothetical protein
MPTIADQEQLALVHPTETVVIDPKNESRDQNER